MYCIERRGQGFLIFYSFTKWMLPKVNLFDFVLEKEHKNIFKNIYNCLRWDLRKTGWQNAGELMQTKIWLVSNLKFTYIS